MRVLAAALGSRGDVEPFALIAAALAARGHDVTLAVDPGHRRALPGVTHADLGDLEADDLAAVVTRALASPHADGRSALAIDGFFVRRADALRARMDALAGGFELLVLSEWLLFAEGGRLRWNPRTAVVVFVPTPIADYRALAPLPCLRLAAMSERFAPHDEIVRRAWSFTGFWLRRGGGALPAPIEAFLAAGAPPMFLTMGSMIGFDAPALAAAFVAAARGVGRRAILQRGWARLDAPAADDVLVVDEVDYEALFPRCAALFMHGGTGTVAHAMRAGRPLAFLPLVNDQLVWARTLAEAGNSLGQADPQHARVADLHRLMGRALADPRPAQAATALAARLRGEDGLTRACELLEA